MRKITLALLASLTLAANANKVTTYVTNKSQFNNALSAAYSQTASDTCEVVICAELADDGTSAKIADNSVVINTGSLQATSSKHPLPVTGTLIIRSEQTDIDNLPQLQTGFDYQEACTNLSIIVENVSIQFRSGKTASSGQVFYWEKITMDKMQLNDIIIRNCEITNIPRTLFRTAPTSAKEDADGNALTPSKIQYFELSGCKVHDMNIANGNNWALNVFGSMPIEVNISNNVFYDMPYTKGIIQMAYVNNDGTSPVIRFYNNTVMLTKAEYTKSDETTVNNGCTIINAGNYLAASTNYIIYNNLFLGQQAGKVAVPTDVQNYTLVEGGTNVLSAKEVVDEVTTQFGVMIASNNFFDSKYAALDRGSNIIDETGSDYIDESNQVGEYDFGNFYNAAESNFIVEKANNLYSLGSPVVPVSSTSDEGNADDWISTTPCIGAPLMYVDEFPVPVQVNVAVIGSNSASVAVSPVKDSYFKGDEITITLDLKNTYYRTYNTFDGWSDGNTETVRNIVLDGDLNLNAYFTANIDAVAAWDFTSNGTSNSTKSEVLAEYGDLAGVATIKAFAADTVGIGNANQSFTARQAEVDAGYVTSVGTKIAAAWNSVTNNYEIKARTIDGAADSIIVCAQRATAARNYVEGKFETRAAKFGEDETEKQMAIISMRTPRNTRDYNRNYAVIELPAEGLSNIKVDYFIGTDNNASKIQKLYYSTDGENYTEIADAAVELTNGQWSNVQATLPAACNNAAKVYIKIQGQVNDGDKAENIAYTSVSSAFNPEKLFDYDVFEYIGNVLITADSATGVVVTEADAAEAAAAPVKVIENGGIVIIKDGKKFTAAGAQVK
ncbi:MAG: hypothetical protein IJV60_06720 [Prevotella sp.]|nr:hypothetical protein [Prevotella sp.]